MDLSGKTIIVTGVASGIGAATAAEIRRRGGDVIGVDRHPAPGIEQVHLADLSDRRSLDELAAALPDGADGLCNIAGVAPTQPGDVVLTVNTLAPIRLTTAMAPRLAPDASIVNLASMAGNGWRDHLDEITELLAIEWDEVGDFVARRGIETGSRSYFLSKEALIVWTMQNRWMWRNRGVRMNCVSPGAVETPILPDFIEMLGERAQESVRNMERHGRPEDIAPVVAFLLSDDAAWFRGANVSPDGGMGAHLALKRHGLE